MTAPASRSSALPRAAIALASAAWLFQWVRMWLASGDPVLPWLFPPIIAAYLAWERRSRRDEAAVSRQTQSSNDLGSPGLGSCDNACRPSGWRVALAGAMGLTFALFARPWLEPFPGWPLAEWTEAGGLTLLILALLAGSRGTAAARHWAPILVFALAALPWPAFITHGALGALREGTASALAESFTFFGLPAVADGTLLRIGTGTIGIEEACGGIRSLQFGVLLALAIGILRHDSAKRLARLVAAAIVLALVANALRLATLTAICGKAGIVAVERWHDPVAAGEYLAVLGGLALLALRARPPAAASGEGEADSLPGPAPAKSLLPLCAATLLLLPLAEALVQTWFLRGDARAATALAWTAHLPASAPGYAPQPWPETTQSLLHCDRHEIASWRDDQGRLRAGYVLGWDRGQTAAYSISSHNPDICLPLAGNRRTGPSRVLPVRLGAAQLPFTVETFAGRDGGFSLYYLAWNLTAGEPLTSTSGAPAMLGLGTRWQEVAHGRRRIAALTLAVAIFDAADAVSADAQFREELGRIAILQDRIRL